MREAIAFALYVIAAGLVGFIIAEAIGCWVRRDER